MYDLKLAFSKRLLACFGRLLVLLVMQLASQLAGAGSVAAVTLSLGSAELEVSAAAADQSTFDDRSLHDPVVDEALSGRPIAIGQVAQNFALRPMPRPFEPPARREDTRLLGTWFGSLGWGATAGNGGGVGRVFPYWSYRWQVDRSGTIERMRFNLPRRPGYFGGTGGIMRLTIRRNAANDWPDLTDSGVLWHSPLYTFSAQEGQSMQQHTALSYVAGFGTDEIVEMDIGPLEVYYGEIYHFVWTNEDDNVHDNWFSINNAFNQSLPHEPYHPYRPWAKFNTLTSSDGRTFAVRHKWIPYILIGYMDDVWVGQSYFDGGSTTKIATPEAPTLDKAGREIVGDWQIRQRWTHASDTITVTRWRGRVWRRTADINGGLRIRLEREEADDEVAILADITVPASEIFWTDYDNQEDQVFPPIDVPLGSKATLENGQTYRLRLSATEGTRYAMRAPVGYSKRYINIGWPAWLGRGEYSTDGGKSWVGMHAYGTDDRNDCDWNMALHNIER